MNVAPLLRRILTLVAVAAATASAQTGVRRATNVAALMTEASFYHLQPVLIAGRVSRADDGRLNMTDEEPAFTLVYDGSVPDDLVEVRGEFWDLGRMNADDPRLASYDLLKVFGIDPRDPWPRPGQRVGLVVSAIAEVTPPRAPSVRSVVLYPSRYLDQPVTVVGQFGGRNLLGDLPNAPANSRWDFVLRSTDAALWVSNIRPRGRDFDLALDARIDTGRWLEVSGVLRQGRGLQWIDASDGTIALSKPPSEDDVIEAPIYVPPAPPPEVVFSAPIEGELSVLPSASVRVQFSRDIKPASLDDKVKVSYVAPGGGTETPVTDFTTQYLPANRVLEIRFAAPLERFSTVQVVLLEGVLGTDEQALRPWTLTFLTGS